MAGAVCTVMKLVGVFHGRHLMKIWNGATRKFNAHSCWEGAEEMEVTDAGVLRTEFGSVGSDGCCLPIQNGGFRQAEGGGIHASQFARERERTTYKPSKRIILHEMFSCVGTLDITLLQMKEDGRRRCCVASPARKRGGQSIVC